MDRACEVLADCGLFRGLSEESLERLRAIARPLCLVRDQVAFRQGESCPGLYVVGEGAVKIYKLAPSGKEHVLHFAYPGMTFAEVAVIGDFVCPAYAQALEDSRCVLLPAADFRRLLREHHSFCLELMAAMAGWVRSFVAQLEDLTLRDAAARVARHLLQANSTAGTSEFRLPMKKKDLASHLNLTSETLSRTLRRLADAGLIETRYQQHIRITAPQQLRELAEGLPVPGLE